MLIRYVIRLVGFVATSDASALPPGRHELPGVDCTTLMPGPLATLMLAEAGADVIKIERPGGEDMRAMPPICDGEAVVFALLNRGKKSLVLDLKSENDRKALAPLLQKADVIVE